MAQFNLVYMKLWLHLITPKLTREEIENFNEFELQYTFKNHTYMGRL